MKKLLIATIIFVAVNVSCNKKCNCTDSWDANTTYVEGDKVNHDGKCWKATAQGKGIVPGPWMENGNDIWKECK